MSRDRQSESQPSGGAADHVFRLAEPVEHIWQEVRADSSAGVDYGEPGLLIRVAQLNSNGAGRWCELHRVRKQIPDDLLEAVLIAEDVTFVRSHFRFQANAFAIR